MTEDTRSLLTLLGLIFASGALTFAVVIAVAAYSLRGDK
jgi:hypothetical protein